MITARRKQILEYIWEFYEDHSYMPSMREIGKGVGLKSTSSIEHHIIQLYLDGYLESEHNGRPRAFRLTDKYFKNRIDPDW